MDTKEPSRYSTTEYNRHARVQARLKSIFAEVRAFHLSHAALLKKVSALRGTHDFKRLTTYYLGMFDGLHYALRDELYRHYLEWRVSLHGKLVLGKDVPAGQWSEVEGDKGAHVWSDKPEAIFHGPDKEGAP